MEKDTYPIWKQKLTSRKLWVAIVSFVTLILLSFGVNENQAAQVASIIMAGANIVAYIIGEGLVDSSREQSEKIVNTTTTTITKSNGSSIIDE